MKLLYCPDCWNYLEGGCGDLVDCSCGWRQPADEPECDCAAFEPDWASAPGDTLTDIMEENDWSLAHVADLLDMDDLTLAQLLSGSLSITDDLAETLANVFGSTPDFWQEREKQYRSAIIRLGQV